MAVVTFDKPLATGPLQASQWLAYREALRWLQLTATAYDELVIVEHSASESTILSDRVVYDDAVGDLQGVDGQPVASFTVYP